MKFSEMPYQRPNLDEIKAQFAAVTQRFAAAPDYAAAKAAFLDEQTLNKHVDTLANLASIRNTIDTRDEFYDDEMNFWNAATPQIQECQNTWSAALLASPYRKRLGEEYGELMFLNAEIAQKAFSPDILDEMAQENDLSTQYGKLIASAQIPFEGGVYTLSQLSPFKNDPDDARRLAAWKAEGLSIGLVPTMGSLHEGHESLMDAARAASDRVVVSVFVNPIQFGPGEDYEAYPRDLERDARICERHGVDVVFHPEVDDMYAPAHNTFVVMETLTDSLCGASRPGHFRGVCTVVTKLFNIVTPDRAYFGQKDAQQLAVIKRMVKDLNMPLTITGCPIIREEDGLAKSSRNTYLSPEERKAALVLSRSIFLGKEMVEKGERDCKKILASMTAEIEKEPLAKIDYVKIVDLDTMQQVEKIDRGILAAIAVYIGKTRLIDNFMYELEN